MKRSLTRRRETDAFQIVRAVGLTLPGVVAATRYDGSPVLKLHGCFMAGLAAHRSAEPATLVVRVGFDDRALLIEDAPETYYLTDYYEKYPLVLVRLACVDRDALRPAVGVVAPDRGQGGRPLALTAREVLPTMPARFRGSDMRLRLIGIVVSVVAITAFARPVSGQALPRTADGKPDLSGIWQAVNTANWNILAHGAEKDIPAGLGVVEGDEIPYQPWAAAKQKENFTNRATADPESKCFLPGVPRIMYMPYPFQIFQTPAHIAMTFEYVHAVRRVFMNSPHPEGEVEWYMGDSRGHWEGDTLVVDVVDFTDQTWLDRSGNFHSASLHVIERYTPVSANHVNYEVTIEDPKVFTRPWKMSMPLYRRLDKGMRILENECYAFGFEHTWLKPPQ